MVYLYQRINKAHEDIGVGTRRLCAFDFRWLVGVIGVDREREDEGTTLVHALKIRPRG